MSYDDMPAGPELDRMVAEKVMGWTQTRHVETDGWEAGMTIYGPWMCNGALAPHQCFTPSTNIAHAWEVVEKMKERGWYGTIGRRDQLCWCTFEDYEGSEISTEDADTAPLAICRASLAAVR